ncbi:MAG: two-component system sensor histidine kinase NtrB [Thiohalospira sp.]
MQRSDSGTPSRRSSGRREWLFLGAALLGGGALLAWWVLGAAGGMTAPGWPAPTTLVILALVALLAAVVAVHLRYRRVVERLHEGILAAQEGTLEPIAGSVPRTPDLARVVEDYNVMMRALRAMFASVEECQARVLTERNKMNALLQSLPGALLSVDDNLRVTAINSETEKLFGRPARDLEGHNLFEILDVDEGDREVLRDAFLYKRAIHNQVLHARVNDAERWISLNMSFLTEEETGMDAVLTLQDMTDYKNLQESVYNREKLVAMGQLAAGVAHELNTPLGNILGYCQLLADGTGDAEKQRRYAGIVGDEARRCSRIVSDLLNYARKEECYAEGCDINQLLRELVDTFRSCRLKRQPVTLDLELAEEEPRVHGGCGELDIVFSNLILNALRVLDGDAGARIRITTRVTASGDVVAAVEDNGPGVSAEIRGQIFDPFFTTSDVGDGSGLGLSISQAMIGRRGGSLRLDTGYADGARFVVRLQGERP